MLRGRPWGLVVQPPTPRPSPRPSCACADVHAVLPGPAGRGPAEAVPARAHDPGAAAGGPDFGLRGGQQEPPRPLPPPVSAPSLLPGRVSFLRACVAFRWPWSPPNRTAAKCGDRRLALRLLGSRRGAPTLHHQGVHRPPVQPRASAARRRIFLKIVFTRIQQREGTRPRRCPRSRGLSESAAWTGSTAEWTGSPVLPPARGSACEAVEKAAQSHVSFLAHQRPPGARGGRAAWWPGCPAWLPVSLASPPPAGSPWSVLI